MTSDFMNSHERYTTLIALAVCYVSAQAYTVRTASHIAQRKHAVGPLHAVQVTHTHWMSGKARSSTLRAVSHMAQLQA